MILPGKKVRLRSVKIQDTKMLHRWINNKKLNRFLGAEIPISLAKEKKIVRQMVKSKGSKHFIIELVETKEPIGMMSLHHINKKHRRAFTGAYLAYAKHWGKGYGSDAKMVLLKYAFTKLKLNRVESHAFPHNPRSVRYSLKCGYKREGLLRQSMCKKGKFYDSIILGVLKQDWLKVAKRQGYLWTIRTKGSISKISYETIASTKIYPQILLHLFSQGGGAGWFCQVLRNTKGKT